MASGRMEFHSQSIMLHTNFSFILPNDVEMEEVRDKRHYDREPMNLILLHGLTGTDTDWLYGSMAQWAAIQYNLNIFMPTTGNTFYLDKGYIGANAREFITEELPEYIGKTVNFRTYKNSYKDKKTKKADKEDWVIFDGTQEPIIDAETWELAQKLRMNVRKANAMGEPNVLTGKVYCADCGAAMYNHRQRNARVKTYYTAEGELRYQKANPEDTFECSTYNLSRQKYGRSCSCHHISTKALRKIILETIQKTCSYVSLNEREFVEALQEASAAQNAATTEAIRVRLERNEKRVHELDMLIRKIYEDNVAGRLPDRLFQSMLTDYEGEQSELTKIIEIDRGDIDRSIGGQKNAERFIALVRKYKNIDELTPAIINEFIDKILVHEPSGSGAERTIEVEVYLNYIGQFRVPEKPIVMTEEERIAAEKAAEKLRRKREYNRKYMKKIREKSKRFKENSQVRCS